MRLTYNAPDNHDCENTPPNHCNKWLARYRAINKGIIEIGLRNSLAVSCTLTGSYKGYNEGHEELTGC